MNEKLGNPPLKSRVAWVTGSSQGIGRAISNELARLGCRVALHGIRDDAPGYFGADSPKTMRHVADEITKTHGTETMSVLGDLTLEAEVERMADEIRAEWGQIDILICCAGGIIGAGGPARGRSAVPKRDDALFISLEDFHSVMDRNLMTAVLCCREVAPEMMKRKWGRIITLGSQAGTKGHKTSTAYHVAKAAVHMFTRCLADQLREYDISVNCIAPGLISSERLMHNNPHWKKGRSGTLDRVGGVEEVASLAGFLSSPGGAYISGQVIQVDGALNLFAS